MNREPYPSELAERPKTKIWIWTALGLLITNFVVVGIVAFLIHRDSVQPDPQPSASQQRQL
ncbi:hypothetical protein H6G41_13935 [Tolypothrix sp. FACHB-123]|uniref:hypothetical protein n=1 Tax=Tolypothrix sp. FACHB-123 TaxID=2692868 RepID=UPI001686933A|nr:hypothetical protein [Tolypothrix sp. FACHB-123]MBD2355705.1 hypothetical protein [Tolypothrix sp. FACHB-123]